MSEFLRNHGAEVFRMTIEHLAIVTISVLVAAVYGVAEVARLARG